MRQTDTKTLILDTAQDLIQRLGVNGMSYQDISEVVGIRKASVHTHFPKKEDLLVALLDRYNDRLLQAVDSILASNNSPEAKLRSYCSLYETTLSSGNQDKACLCTMLGAEFSALTSSSLERVRSFYEANEVRLVRLLTEGRQIGHFNFSGDVTAMATLIFSSLQGGLLMARVHKGVPQLHAVIEQLVQLVQGQGTSPD